MTKVSSTQDYHHEKAIIDALLKISEIVQKTETNRQYAKTKKPSKRTVGDGDFSELVCENEHQQVPLPPPMRTLESYVSGFNQNSSQIDPIHQQISMTGLKSNRLWNSSGNNKQSDQSSSEHSHKRHRSKNLNDASPCSNPTAFRLDQQQISSMTDSLIDPRTALNANIDQELQITLEKYVKNQLLSSTKSLREDIQKQREARFASFTKSPTEKLINALHPSQSVANLHHYNKQRQLALLATKQGNYTLSSSIYTDLLHNYSDYPQMKSEILSSRAMTSLFEEKYFESIDDCTRAIAFNQWNKLAYIIRGACWMIKEEYSKAIEDYSKLFHFFDQSQYILDLLNLAYEKSQSLPLASSLQPAVYLCYPYQNSSMME